MPEPDAGSEQRVERRNNLFVVAVLHWPGAPVAVRIRNMSPNGALVEGAGLPDVGTAVRLSRGQRNVAGELMWRGEMHAGLQFSAPVNVADWLPANAGNAGQQRVDQIVFEAKAARVATGIVPNEPSAPDYAAIARALVKAGDELVAVPGLAENHPDALQAIDIAAQALNLLTRR
ncbi:MAG: hypothetical protein ABIS38_09145 [Sphingomicrobium sp.]